MFLAAGAGVAKGKHTSIRRSIPDITPTIGSLLQFSTPSASGNAMTEILEPTGVRDRTDPLPYTLYLSSNYPNPFNPTTNIRFSISSIQFATLKVFDLLGREVAILVREEEPEGRYSVTWDAEGIPSGGYFYQLKAGDRMLARKMP